MDKLLKPKPKPRKGYLLLLVVLLVPLVCAFGVRGYFRLSSETKALRQTVMSAIPGQWNKRFAVHVGWLTMDLVRAGSQFVNLPPEPRAALEALHGAEVGVYKLDHDPVRIDAGAIFAAADRAMKTPGWERIVGVVEADQLVAAYVPARAVSAKRMACALVVLHQRDLVVVSARGNLQPLLQIAGRKLESNPEWRRMRRDAIAVGL